MKLSILCIGKLKSNHDKQLIDEYIKRLRPWEVKILEGGHGTLIQEAAWFVHHLKPLAHKIMLCEHGSQMTSPEFAQHIAAQQTKGCSEFQICIGGADGFNNSLYNLSNLRLSLGKMTWPHMMVRTLIIEQLYRAKMIMENHPYHK